MQLTMLTLPDQFTQHPSVLRYLSGASWHFDSSTTDASLSNVKNHIVCGDAIEVLSSLPSECVDLIHTSPPYNIDRPYEMSTSDKSPGLEYFNFLRDSVRQLKRVLRPGGSIFWQTGCGNLPTAKHFPRNTVVSRRRRDRFHPLGESGLATRD